MTLGPCLRYGSMILRRKDMKLKGSSPLDLFNFPEEELREKIRLCQKEKGGGARPTLRTIII